MSKRLLAEKYAFDHSGCTKPRKWNRYPHSRCVAYAYVPPSKPAEPEVIPKPEEFVLSSFANIPSSPAPVAPAPIPKPEEFVPSPARGASSQPSRNPNANISEINHQAPPRAVEAPVVAAAPKAVKSGPRVIQSIDASFNSFQVQDLTQRLLKFGRFGMLNELFEFFINLRKAIMKSNIKGTDPVPVLEPAIAEAIEHRNVPAPQNDWFAIEVTHSTDGKRQYNEFTWAKMFAMMLPVPGQRFDLSSHSFEIIAKISQEVSVSLSSYIRTKKMQESEDALHSRIEKLRQEGKPEKFIQRIIANARKEAEKESWEDKDKLKKSIWEFTDTMIAYAKEVNPRNGLERSHDLSDPKMLAFWRLVTRNPCFPNEDFMGYPATMFAFTTMLSVPSDEYIKVHQRLRFDFHSTFPNCDPYQPTEQEFKLWSSLYPFLALSKSIFLFKEGSMNSDSLGNLDECYRTVCKVITETAFNPSWVPDRSKSVESSFPYGKMGLVGGEFIDGILTMKANHLTPTNIPHFEKLLGFYDTEMLENLFIEFTKQLFPLNALVITFALRKRNIDTYRIFNKLIENIGHSSYDLEKACNVTAMLIIAAQQNWRSSFTQTVFDKLVEKNLASQFYMPFQKIMIWFKANPKDASKIWIDEFNSLESILVPLAPKFRKLKLTGPDKFMCIDVVDYFDSLHDSQ